MLTTFLSNEKELLLCLSDGSEKAFEKIYQFYSPRLYGKLIKLLRSEACANEVLQDVFLKIWELRQSIDPDKCFRSYLFRIAVNKVYDYFRQAARDKKMRDALPREGGQDYSPVEETWLSTENISTLNLAIDSLPPQRRQIFRLCKLDGKSYKEVSSKLGISTSTISDHIVKANHSIRRYFCAS